MGAVVQPLPTAYLIFRAPSQAAGKCWMDALELSLRCSALLLRSASNSGNNAETTMIGTAETMTHETQWSEADYEKHFYDHANPNKNQSKPLFLAKYIPPTPPENRISSNDLRRQITNSPCPSPTPIFQKLYIAVSHWERVLADSPNVLHEKHRIIKDLESLGVQSNCFFPNRDEGDDTDDECSNEPSPIRYSAENVNAIRLMDGKFFQKSISNDTHDGDSNHLDIDSQGEGANAIMSGLESESESECEPEEEFAETQYIHCPEDEFGAAGEQVEELADEHKSLIWFLVKQVRPGMDLSKVVLPTFILEPRSFLDKLSDSYYHADYLSNAVLEDDPFNRMKMVVQWYMSGFYKKPKGLKKPYNPILGETFRCYWEHLNGSRTFYIAEQVSHHPPISAFYVTNRQDGFSISCSMLAKSKFYGNSTSAILEGTAALTLLPRGETYTLTIPYAHCKGILMGTLSMELGGKIAIECENTGYKADVEFKLKPFLGGSEYTNLVTARIKLGKETLASINGHWDGEIKIKDTRSGEESVLFAPTADVRSKRLKRFTVPIESQGLNESERLWQHVSAAIHRDDQVAATEEKTALEESQRALVKERKATCTEWTPVLFHQDLVTGQWHYKCADLRPWDPRNDLRQFESNYKIQTKTRHQAPMVRTASIISSEPIILQADSRSSLAALKKTKRILGRKISTPDLVDASDSSHSNELSGKGSKMLDSIDNINKQLMEQSKKIASIQLSIDRLSFAPRHTNAGNIHIHTIIYIGIGLLIHSIALWLIMRK
ncbi:hypothetical protein HA402_003521 [Bradysia odoriphaga]|nr:hypothetical protein HA402_003521 [Bradysia odoriphaga]